MTETKKKILITGGCSGIGKALVIYFLAKNYEIGVFDIDQTACQSLRAEFSNNVFSWVVDVSDPESVDLACGKAFQDGFYPDILINNAGIIHSEPLINLLKKSDRIHSRKSWRKVIASDLDSVFYVTSNVVENMIKFRRKGVIISISSICAQGNPGQSAYSSAKAGVNALTKTWSKELGPLGLRFAAIAPGFLDTDSTNKSLSKSQLDHVRRSVPLKKLGDVESIVKTAEFIINNEYVNGAILKIDGGLVL